MTLLERSLKREVTELKRKNRALLERLASAKPFTGAFVEFFFATLIGGALTNGHANYDVRGADGTKFEVKFSRLNIPYEGANCHRWTWTNLLGSGGAKKFHRLILVGQTDPRHRRDYCDPRSPYVIFDIPYLSVARLMGNRRWVQISTNPGAKVSEIGRELFRRFHVSRAKLKERYVA